MLEIVHIFSLFLLLNVLHKYTLFGGKCWCKIFAYSDWLYHIYFLVDWCTYKPIAMQCSWNWLAASQECKL